MGILEAKFPCNESSDDSKVKTTIYYYLTLAIAIAIDACTRVVVVYSRSMLHWKIKLEFLNALNHYFFNHSIFNYLIVNTKISFWEGNYNFSRLLQWVNSCMDILYKLKLFKSWKNFLNDLFVRQFILNKINLLVSFHMNTCSHFTLYEIQF